MSCTWIDVSWRVPHVAVVHDVPSEAECETLIRRIDSLGPAIAPITTGAGFVVR